MQGSSGSLQLGVGRRSGSCARDTPQSSNRKNNRLILKRRWPVWPTCGWSLTTQSITQNVLFLWTCDCHSIHVGFLFFSNITEHGKVSLQQLSEGLQLVCLVASEMIASKRLRNSNGWCSCSSFSSVVLSVKAPWKMCLTELKVPNWHYFPPSAV